MWMTSVLVFDTDTSFARHVAELLGGGGSACVVAAEPDDARRLLATGGFSVFLFGCAEGPPCPLGLLDSARRLAPHMGVILMVRPDQVRLSIQCMKRGIDDDILIPFDMDSMLRKVASVAQRRRLAPPSQPVAGRGAPGSRDVS
ncbi:histidine kinase [Nitratidesulfovibrio liaohensis]|uniref:Histidine kinase n=1 Tax=Nitratidesulfovibrio liaohensis TaxID=2604158 RepID=A0ABY9R6P0_9BACT|nr:histidine kinase [Nitratidesulfovibrio liaohensis]WMW66862.1 histidine kinase [Nitratidesulfovibrio liaohensis]